MSASVRWIRRHRLPTTMALTVTATTRRRPIAMVSNNSNNSNYGNSSKGSSNGNSRFPILTTMALTAMVMIRRRLQRTTTIRRRLQRTTTIRRRQQRTTTIRRRQQRTTTIRRRQQRTTMIRRRQQRITTATTMTATEGYDFVAECPAFGAAA